MKQAEKKGDFTFSCHAERRLNERKVAIHEIRQAMRSGYHEKKKDTFSAEHESWNYAWRGKPLTDEN